jgi:dTDP-glucose 4,6-dehydratase
VRDWLDTSDLVNDMEVFFGDITDRDSVKSAIAGAETVFHLAALIAIPYSYHAPLSYVRTNVEGTLNVLQVARDTGVRRVIHTSTSEVYGTARTIPIDEDHPLQGQSPYSATKIAADKMAEAFHVSFGLPVTTVRPFNTYGPRQSTRAVIPTVITQCLAGKDIKLGNLAPTRDLTYVEDTVAGIIAAASYDRVVGETINLGTGTEISIGDLARMIKNLCGGDNAITQDDQRVRPEGSEVERLLADNGKAQKMIGWTPETGIQEGLRRTIDWFRVNQGRYRPDDYVL